jgi:polyisoprenoid-binding protein YceI
MTTVEGLSAGTWTIDPVHSEVAFVVRHMMVSKVRGRFQQFSGEITIGEDALASSVTAEIDMTSITTDNEMRDNHLRTHDFFEVEKHPTMTFTSTSVAEKGEDYVVTGDLTIKGNTHQVELVLEYNGSVTDPQGAQRAGFSAGTQISRKAFGVDIETPLGEDGKGVVIGDKITISLEIEAVKA